MIIGIITLMHGHAHDTAWATQALTNLQAQGLRNGGARRIVIEHLGAQPCCRSAQEIFDGIRAGGGRIGIASVYRALDQLVELRLLQRVDLGDGIARFEPAHTGGEHHHHLVCDGCGKVEPFYDPGLEQALEQAASRLDYGMRAHEVVLHGDCGGCRAAG
jgi:Fur family ferric uptake transcriptional regulator